MSNLLLYPVKLLVKRKIFGENKDNNYGVPNDPYHTSKPHRDQQGRPTGKVIKRRDLPPQIPEHDAKILVKVSKRAHRLDSCINLCGFKLGISAIVGLIPGLGDVFDILMAWMVFNLCRKVSCGLDSSTKRRMTSNIFVDFAIGFVPVLGDLADAYFKANRKNAELLRRRLYMVYCPELLSAKERKEWRYAAENAAPSEKPQPLNPQSSNPQIAQASNHGTEVQSPVGPPPSYYSQPQDEVVRPEAARTQSGGRGWLGSVRKQNAEPDVERGEARPAAPARPSRAGVTS